MNPLYVVIPMFVVFFIILCTVNQYTALEWIIFLCFLCIIGVIGTNYFLGVELTTTLSSLFSKPEIDIDIVKTENKHDQGQNNQDQINQGHDPETYHINGQFDYSMARSVCKAYNAKLASFSQIKDAYDKGAEWCDYGWSEDNMVLFPTQESTWKKNQNGKKDQCGIPGINGGYNHRINQKLGVNCYGVKPTGKMPIMAAPVEQKVIPKQGTVSPFNYVAWSQF
jgi:hypothetical protein